MTFEQLFARLRKIAETFGSGNTLEHRLNELAKKKNDLKEEYTMKNVADLFMAWFWLRIQNPRTREGEEAMTFLLNEIGRGDRDVSDESLRSGILARIEELEDRIARTGTAYRS